MKTPAVKGLFAAAAAVVLAAMPLGGQTVSSAVTVNASGYLPELILDSTYTVGHGVALRQNPKQSSPTKVKINQNGKLVLTDISSRILAPLDLEIASGGKVFFACGSGNPVYARSTLVAHRLVVNGVEMAKGRYQGATSGGNSGWFEAWSGSSIIVPYVWTGAGDGSTWADAANWEGNVVPPNADDYTTAVDLSKAAGRTIRISGIIKLTSVAFIPSGDGKSVTVGGEGSLVVHAPVSLNGAFVIAENCKVVLDVDLNRAAVEPAKKASLIGGGVLEVRRGFPSATLETAGDPATVRGPFALDGTVEFAGPDARIQLWWPERYDCRSLSATTMENEGSSRIVVRKGCSLDAQRIFASEDGFYSLDKVVQEGGTVDLTQMDAKDLYLVRHNGYERILTYELQDGEFIGSVRLGCHCFSKRRYPGGVFRMTGGTLTAAELTSEGNQNYFKLEGGTLRLGSGGVRRTNTATDRTYLANASADLQLGGVTVEVDSTENVSCDVPVLFTGTGGATVFDCGEDEGTGGTLTFAAGASGAGSFVKRGSNALVFAGSCSFGGDLTIEEGAVTFDSTAKLSGAARIFALGGRMEVLSAAEVTAKPSLVVLADVSSLVLGAGVDLEAEHLVVGGKGLFGTVKFGEGTVTVVPPAGAVVWGGDDNGLWSIGENWSSGSVPNATATVDLTCAMGKTIRVDTEGHFGKLVFAYPDRVKLMAAAGGAFVFPAESYDGQNEVRFDVGKDATLEIDAPVTILSGKRISKYGQGRLVLEGGVSATEATGHVIARTGDLEVKCAATDIRFRSEAADEDGLSSGTIVVSEGADLSCRSSVNAVWGSAAGDAVQNGGTIDMTTPVPVWTTEGGFPLCNSNGQKKQSTYTLNGGLLKVPNFPVYSLYKVEKNGNFEFVQNGGTAYFKEFRMSRYGDSGGMLSAGYVLNGGTLQLVNGFTTAETRRYSIVLNGGTIETLATQTLFPNYKAVTLGGDVTIKPAAGVTATIPCDLAGAGSLAVGGEGTLKATVPLTGVTNLVLSGSAKLNLGFSGVQTVETLTIDGVRKAAGDYSVTAGKDLRGRLTGTGTLRVLHGGGGLCIMLR